MGKGSLNGIGSSQASIRWFYFMLVCAQIAGIIVIILVSVFFGKYRGGFGWGSDLTKVFNFHPFFMILGMIIFYGDAILVYRVFSEVKKIWIKILHASLLALSLIFASIGLKAVFDSHNHAKPPQSNLNSFHSWMGLTTVILFGLQWVCGFVSFLFPKLNVSIRRVYMPSHKFWGKIIFIFAVCSVLTGITEYSIFKQLSSDETLIFQRNMIYFLAIFVLIFAIIILYLVGNLGFQRPPNEDEGEHIPLTGQ